MGFDGIYKFFERAWVRSLVEISIGSETSTNPLMVPITSHGLRQDDLYDARERGDEGGVRSATAAIVVGTNADHASVDP